MNSKDMSASLKQFCIQAIHDDRHITYMEITLREFVSEVLPEIFFPLIFQKDLKISYFDLKNVQSYLNVVLFSGF